MPRKRKPRVTKRRGKRAPPKRLIRYLGKGERLRVLGARGKPVSSVKSGRNYILEIRKGSTLVGYANNVKAGAPQPRKFTLSMIARMKHTRRQQLKRAPKSDLSFEIHNRDYLKYQIPKRVKRRIGAKKGEAFGFRITVGKERFLTPFVYSDGRLKDDYLDNIIVSNWLMTLNQNRIRMSPLLAGMEELKKVRRRERAKVELMFTEVEFERMLKRCPECDHRAHPGRCPVKWCKCKRRVKRGRSGKKPASGRNHQKNGRVSKAKRRKAGAQGR